MDIDEVLAAHEAGEPAIDRAWRELCGAAVGLGAALARFDLTLKAYGKAKSEAPSPETSVRSN